MVRKRSRQSRKHYESDDNDTDSDYALDDTPAESAPKKYSLRQRKRSLFLADYEYEDDEDIPPPKHSESDDDFEVEKETVISDPPSPVRRRNNVYVEPAPETSMPDDELIDFEDVIRADIVVNKNRIDYDNIISKTEIEVCRPEQSQPQQPVVVRSKRGRKPKVRPETEIDSSLLEPETEVQEDGDDLNDKDYDPQEDIVNEAASFVSTELREEQNKDVNIVVELPISGGNLSSSIHSSNSTNKPDSTSVKDPLRENSSDDEGPAVTIHPIYPERNVIQKNSQESVIKFNENVLQNGNKYHIEQPEVHIEFKQEIPEDDDDVVFIEDKNTEVIVLDD